MSPKVTVLMPVYNGAPYLKEAIESILSQTFKDFEFIIIDDGSTDNSYEIARSYLDQRIKLYKNEFNLRVAETLNKGIKLAQGEYIARMDADDVSLPNRLARQVNFLDSHPDITIVGSWVKVIGDTHEYVWKYESNPEKLKTKMFFNCSVAHPTIMMRKKAMLDNNLWYNNMGVEDFDLWARACEKIKMSNINKVFLHYRINTNQSSGTLSAFHAEGLNEVLTQQIKKLGIEPTNQEVAIHRRASNYQPFMSAAEIVESVEWFNKIKIANGRAGYYDKKVFSEIIANLWYGMLIRGRNINGIWEIFVLSSATRDLSVYQKLKFVVKFVINKIWRKKQ